MRATAIKALAWLALALVLVRVQCAGCCHEATGTGKFPCHHSNQSGNTPAPCGHCVAADRMFPTTTAHLAAPLIVFQSLDPPARAILSRERAPELPAPLPPPLMGLSSVLLRV